jgi:hypothetical protein
MPSPSPQSESESDVEEEYDASTANEEEVREDIAKVMQNPSTLSRLQHRKHPRVIIAAVRTRPNMLENISPSQGLTEEVIQELMKENGKWLFFVPKIAKTRFVCLVALYQTDKAIDFVPKEMKDNPSNPIFYEIAVDMNPANIVKVPFEMLTEEMIYTAFDKNPNIINLTSMSFKLREKIREYEHAPIPPSLERQMSETHSDQGPDGVCGRHAFSRVIVKNFFELILPLQYTGQYNEKGCNEFLSTTYLMNEYPTASLRELTPQNCSGGGYLKILLFLHCFFLFQKHISTVKGRDEGWLECVQVSKLYQYMYKTIEIPKITHDQRHDLKDALQTVQTVQRKYNISLVTFHFKHITIANIKKITDHGLYIMLRIEDSKSDDGTHLAHFVLIVGAFDDYMLVKNSWENDTIYKIKFGYPFYLGQYTYDVLTDCSFVIPVQQDNNEEFGDLTHVDSYLRRYSELKTKLNDVVVNVMNKSCPSKNKEPVECDEQNPFRQQAKLFHPDKNPRCPEEAEKKFNRLTTLHGCRHESPSQTLRLLGEMRKRKLSRKRKHTKDKRFHKRRVSKKN